MTEKSHRPIVISIQGLPKKDRRKVARRMTKEVTKDKQYRKALRRCEQPVSKEVAEAAARAAVNAVLGVKTGKPAVPPKKSALEKYTELVGRFAAARKKYKIKQKKKLKAAIKNGYDPKTGVFTLQRGEKVKLGKKGKPYKAKKKK